MAPGATLAQAAAPAPTNQAAPAAAAPTDAAPVPGPEAQGTAPVTTTAANDVTKVGGKYMKDGRKATKTEIAEFKKAGKAKQE